MKKCIYLFAFTFMIMKMNAQKVVGGGLTYKMAFLGNDSYSAGINQTCLAGFYQLNNLSETGEREIYLGADLAIPSKFKLYFNNDSLYKRLNQFTISVKSLHYFTGSEESKISLNQYFQLALPVSYINTVSSRPYPSELQDGDGLHIGATFEYGVGMRLLINNSLAIYPSIGLNVGVLSFAGLMNSEQSVMAYGNLNFLIKGIYTIDED